MYSLRPTLHHRAKVLKDLQCKHSLSKAVPAARQLAATGDAGGPAAETAELAARMVVPVLYSAARLTSCPLGPLPPLATQGSLREALVRKALQGFSGVRVQRHLYRKLLGMAGEVYVCM